MFPGFALKAVRQLPLVISLSLCATHAFADDTIAFKGSIIAQTCQVTTRDQIVTLPTVQTQSLAAGGDTAGQTGFAIQLTGCSHGDSYPKNVAAAFGSTWMDPNTGNLFTDAEGATGAANVEYQLLNADGTPIWVNNPATSKGAPIDANGSATLRYLVQYYATGPAGKGSTGAKATFTLTYQ
ncbi:fimbrial protein (plasmid) [Burkholderia pyrrocinia]|uniref:fimbrial protein n=1 Tax=Burkholderia pyrrocinia TaxID=60550 RepID=UPI0038B6A232